MDEKVVISDATKAAHLAIAEVMERAEKEGIKDDEGADVDGKIVLMIASATLVSMYAAMMGLSKEKLMEGISITYDEMKESVDKAQNIIDRLMNDNGGSEWLQ